MISTIPQLYFADLIAVDCTTSHLGAYFQLSFGMVGLKYSRHIFHTYQITSAEATNHCATSSKRRSMERS